MSDTSTRPGPAAPETTYRPLSLLALAGLAVALAYAAVVVLGGLFALLRGTPWLLPGWSALFPIAAAGLALAGLVRVRRSEGAVVGGKLAAWGLLLSALAGAGYWAYAGTLLLALDREAEQYGLDFLTRISGGDLPGAYRLMVPPDERPPEGTGLRDALEARYNVVTPRVPRGQLTSFAEIDYVGVLGRCGPETKFEPAGVEEWDYVRGAYYLKVLYRAAAPGLSFELTVTLRGEEKGSGGRQWQVIPQGTGLKDMAALEGNAEWKQQAAVARQSRDYVEKVFVPLLREGKSEEAFLCTLPPAERDAARQSAARDRLGLLLLAGVGAGAVPCPAPAVALAGETLAADDSLSAAAALPGIDGFLAGALVHADREEFWAPEDLRDELAATVRQIFRRGGDPLTDGLLPDSRLTVPTLRREGGRYVVEHDFAMRVPPRGTRYLIEGRVVVEGDAADADRGSMLAWRVRGVTLVAGKKFQ